MTRLRLATVLLVGLLGAVVLTVAVGAQHSFPVRFDDQEPEKAVEASMHTVGTAVSDALILEVRDAAPFTCDASTLGALYVQNDVCNDITSTDTILCICGDIQTVGPQWSFTQGSQSCTDLEGPCS